MGVNFGGARDTDGRRRRRIATEGEQTLATPCKTYPQAGYLKITRFHPDSEEQARSPIVSLISEAPWKIWTYCLAIPFLVVAIHLGNAQLVQSAASPLSVILDLEQGHIWRFLQGLTLLGCAALCWLISWFHSASVRDFDGCYKSWYWSGWIFLLLGLMAGVDGHLVFSQFVNQSVDLKIANLTTLIWVAPMLSLLLEPFRCFTREMWHCRRSWLCLWGACLSGLTYLLLKLDDVQIAPQLSPQLAGQLIATTASLTCALLFTSLLSQIHYVMYVSSDPVPRRQSWLIMAIMWSVRLLFTRTCNLLAFGQGVLKSGWQGARESGQKRKEQREQNRQRRAEQQAEKKRLQTEQAAEKAAQKMAQKAAQKERVAQEKAETRKRKIAEATSTPAEKPKATRSTTTKRKSARTAVKAEEIAAAETQREPEQVQTAGDVVAAAKPVSAEKSVAEKPVAEKPRVRVKTKAERNQRTSTAEDELSEILGTPQHSTPVEGAELSQSVIPLSQPTADSNDEDNEDDWENGESDGLDPALLKGLSKKEKRRLRKMHRDQQRAKAG